MDNRFPPLVGKADERMIIISYMVTSQILAEWRRSPVIANLDTNMLKDDAKTVNDVAGYVLGTISDMPPGIETLDLMYANAILDKETLRSAKLKMSMYAYCLTGETSGEAEMFCRTMAEMQQICALINQQRTVQANQEAQSKVQAATSMIDLSAVKGPKGFNQ